MLSAYHYVIQYKPGMQHANADGLSCLPLLEPLTEVPLLGDTVCLLESLQAVRLTTKQIRKGVNADLFLSCSRKRTSWLARQ